jgi:hypothetical protein
MTLIQEEAIRYLQIGRLSATALTAVLLDVFEDRTTKADVHRNIWELLQARRIVLGLDLRLDLDTGGEQ